MPDGNTAAIVIAMEAEALRPPRRPAAVGAELMARHRAGRRRCSGRSRHWSRGGSWRPGRVAGRSSPSASRHARPTPRGRRWALGARAIDADALETLLRPPSPSTFVSPPATCPRTWSRPPRSAALARAARRPGAWDRVPLEGITGLRTSSPRPSVRPPASADLLRRPGRPAACLRGLAAPGAPVIVEAPTYLGALAAARAQGLQPVPVPADERGVRPDLWPTRCSAPARGSCTSSRRSRTRTRLARGRAPQAGARRRPRRGRVPDRGRRVRDLSFGTAPAPLFAEDPDGTWSTSARSPSLPRPGCGSAR